MEDDEVWDGAEAEDEDEDGAADGFETVEEGDIQGEESKTEQEDAAEVMSRCVAVTE